jgi:hypothetical protein
MWSISTVLDSLISNDARLTRGIKSRDAMAKTTLIKQKALFANRSVKFKEGTIKMLHLKHSFVWW